MAKKRRAVDKREDAIKKKLTAAVMMLLVSCIMVVTSTYAWFTLSTAPEVTGIQTTIGGNGNLEIALASNRKVADYTPEQLAELYNKGYTEANFTNTWLDGEPRTLTGITSATDINVINESWGNLIQLADGYGVNLLSLLPSELRYSDTEKKIVNNLYVPKYGVDGRINEMATAISGVFNGTVFGSNEGRGLRAFGVSIKMTERQSAYNKYLNELNSNTAGAVSKITGSIHNNGAILANVAVNLAMKGTDGVKLNADEFANVTSLVNDTYDGVLLIDKAIINAINTYLASSQNASMTDESYNAIKATIENLTVHGNVSVDASNKVTVYSNSAKTDELASVTNADIATMINSYLTVYATAEDAVEALKDVTSTQGTDGLEYAWSSNVSKVVGYLMDLDAIMHNQSSEIIKINGYTVEQLKEYVGVGEGRKLNATNAMELLSGLTIQLNDGSGLFYNISKLAGKVSSNFNYSVTYGELSVTDRPANIIANAVDAANGIPYLPNAYTALTGKAPESAGAEASIISDVYAYALDLLFRTNADSSSLLLQTMAADRVYDENSNPETQGAGSFFEFEKTTPDFSDEQMLKLMEAINIVFTDENDNVLARAGLDTRTGKYTIEGSKMIVPIRLINPEESDRYIDGAVNNAYFLEDGSTTDANNAQEIVSLTKNEKTQVSCIVYLDGNVVTNADVANAATSMNGRMNLQFSSSADLKPMEYSGLHINNTDTEGEGN